MTAHTWGGESGTRVYEDREPRAAAALPQEAVPISPWLRKGLACVSSDHPLPR